MSGHDTASLATKRAGSGIARLGRAWRALPPERRLAASASLGLFATLFLPWYQETGLVSGTKDPHTTTASLTGWAAFSWVEAAVLLVAVSVLALLFLRAEGRAFHLPGGDGVIVMAAGGWTCLLVIWRIFDKQGMTVRGQFATTSGIEWGIFTALGVAGVLTYAGSRIRAAHLPEPLLPGEQADTDGPNERRRDASAVSRRSAAGGAGAAAGSAGAGGPAGAAADTAARAGTAARAVTAARAGKPSRTGRRASWAEPVTWDEPPGIFGQAGAPAQAADTTESQAPEPTGAAPEKGDATKPTGADTQLTIPLD